MLDPRDARAWLDAHANLETGVGVPARGGVGKRLLAVERERPLMDLLGSPEGEYPAVHLTGTNGKTSVARMTAALLEAAGLSVGAYTSPHLSRVNERMVWNGEPVADEELDELLVAVAAVEDLLPDAPSYFEILTAAALRWFGDVAVDVAVVEVGLGGTGDATNVVDADVAVVTNVSIDHVEYIGPTLADIAAEKAGIVEPTSALVLGETDPALVPYFLARGATWVARRDVDFGVRANRLAIGGRVLDLYTPYASYDDVFLALHGAHQADNAVVALTAAESFLGRALDVDLVADAFRTVRTPGRLEVVGHQPLVLLDGVKNVAGAHALRAALGRRVRRRAAHPRRRAHAREGAARNARGPRCDRRRAPGVLPSRQSSRARGRGGRGGGVRPRRRPRDRRRGRRRARRRSPTPSTSHPPTGRW